MTVGRLLCCALAISLSEVNALDCQANCLLFGVQGTAIAFRQKNASDGDAGYGEPSSAYELLSLHNAARQDMAAGDLLWMPASNMRLMEWDQELENLAYESLALWLSASCSLSPQECYWTTMSKNLATNYGMAGGPGWAPHTSEIFHSWTNLNSSIGLDNPKFWSSFSNVMDANNLRLGCGQTVLEERGLNARFLLCYYDPGSNYTPNDELFNVSLIYEPGTPCSKCPVGTACNISSTYPSLCAVSDNPTTTSEGATKPPNQILQYMLVILITISYWEIAEILPTGPRIVKKAGETLR